VILQKEIIAITRKAKEASRSLAQLSTKVKNEVLLSMADKLIKEADFLLSENKKDLKTVETKGLASSFIDRLSLDKLRIKEMADGLRQIATLSDPVGEVMRMWRRPNGLLIGKMRVPIGVIGIIYESRPNVTSDCIGLCLKSGNSVILRGGSEAINSNIAIYKVLNKALTENGLSQGTINLIQTTDRKAIDILLKLNDLIDLIIPRGGENLIEEVIKKSRIPVIKHYKGICHVYIDEFADLNMAEEIAFNAKVQRPGVCNAMETLLVHKDIAARFLPGMIKRLASAGVEIRGCPQTQKIVKGIKKATQEDWRTEYLALILSIRVVSSLDEAIEHISKFGSAHSDAIVTDNYKNALEFLRRVDSACVYVNASTRFTDGNQFGMGAEIGISTDKLHARGPMGLEELTTYKYIIFGNGQIRS
jgi:glutamate-5-semialdehyde dehydrogenase